MNRKSTLLALCIIAISLRSHAVEIELKPVVSGLINPLLITNAGDGSGRIFVVEKAGRIRIIKDGVLLSTPFVTIAVNQDHFEGGLLGLAFHPDYANNGFFFVDYTNADGDTIVSRFSVSAGNPDLADPTSEQIIIGPIEQPQDNHNGGMVAFGPDGYLYISLGDGGGSGDNDPGHTPDLGNAQDTSNLLGSILRIDVDEPPLGQTYGIPQDNPFANSNGNERKEIYAYGLRNPFRFSFDPSTSRLFCADVGQAAREEVDLIINGGNYGWRRMEGTLCFNPTSDCQTGSLILPITEYGRSIGTTVTGGYVYRGSEIPDLVGLYVFGDWGSGRVFTLEETAPDTWTRVQKLNTILSLSAFGPDEENELYTCSYFEGVVYKIVERFDPNDLRDQLLGISPTQPEYDFNQDAIIDIADLIWLLIP